MYVGYRLITQERYEMFYAYAGRNTLKAVNVLATYLPSHKYTKYEEQNMWDTAGELMMNVTFFYGHWHMGAPIEFNKQRLWEDTGCNLVELQMRSMMRMDCDKYRAIQGTLRSQCDSLIYK